MLEREVDVGRGRFILGADLHLFQTRFCDWLGKQ